MSYNARYESVGHMGPITLLWLEIEVVNYKF